MNCVSYTNGMKWMCKFACSQSTEHVVGGNSTVDYGITTARRIMHNASLKLVMAELVFVLSRKAEEL